MASTANGIDSVIVISKQSAEGSKALSGGGQVYPRVTATFDTDADKYSSNEIDPSQQQVDTRLGNFRTSGAIKAEAACGTYAPLMAALLRRDFSAGGATAAQTTIAAAAGGLTRSAGSWLADGFDAGNIVRISGMAAPAAGNNAKNFFVTSVTATNLNGQFMDGSAMVAKAAGDTVSVAAAGKRSFTPLTGHTTDWFTAEVQETKIGVNRSFVDQLVSKMDIAVQPNGIATLDFTLMGKAEGPSTPAPYFTAPAAAPVTGKFSGATALLSVNGIPSQICTGLSLSLDGQVKVDPVIGSKYATAASRGKVLGSGQFTVLLQDAAYLDYFKSEAEIPLAYAMASGTAPLADVLGLAMGRIKITSAKVDDGEKNKIVTCAFDVLRYKGADAQHEATTVTIQDSTL
ncbi:phage tail tube protein [Janthinobacterium fluminis]|uniref:Phage tail tube protein n=1 Tax=Janthinobacterium fluminis TaxID=2987524 RepID=A0ABT5K134_9BURK|nr:phage tail tube protein [Janthinobacterium fluminis]MDC8758579.1 phage tail tube protein [Janthinobacterium fluminis]